MICVTINYWHRGQSDTRGRKSGRESIPYSGKDEEDLMLITIGNTRRSTIDYVARLINVKRSTARCLKVLEFLLITLKYDIKFLSFFNYTRIHTQIVRVTNWYWKIEAKIPWRKKDWNISKWKTVPKIYEKYINYINFLEQLKTFIFSKFRKLS